MKKSYFVLTNVLLVAIVGILIGCFFSDLLVGAGLAAFICMLVVLCAPTVLFLLKDKINFPILIASCVFLVFELVANIIFVFKAGLESKTFAIVQASLVGVFLLTLLVIFASTFTKQEA